MTECVIFLLPLRHRTHWLSEVQCLMLSRVTCNQALRMWHYKKPLIIPIKGWKVGYNLLLAWAQKAQAEVWGGATWVETIVRRKTWQGKQNKKRQNKVTAWEGGKTLRDHSGGDVETRGAMCWPNRFGSLPIGQRGPPRAWWGHRQMMSSLVLG